MSFKIISKLIFICIFLLVTNVAADETPQVQKAIILYFESKIEEAVVSFTGLSKQNNAEAHCYLRLIYSENRFEPSYPKLALSHVLSAVDLSHTDAMHQLGLMYDNGIGVKRNALTAVDWCRKIELAAVPIAENTVFYMER